MAIRTDQLTLRMDPRTRYLAQLAAINSRITLASLINGSLLKTVEEAVIYEGSESIRLSAVAPQLWAEHEADRLVKLADRFEFLLTPQQKTIWVHIQGTQKYWRFPLDQGTHNVSDITFNYQALRDDWNSLNEQE